VKFTSAHHPECNKKHRGFAAPCNRELAPGVIEYKHHRAMRAEANRRRADALLEARMPPTTHERYEGDDK
jgi:hypothetical protein